jgi:hypothetical protein
VAAVYLGLNFRAFEGAWAFVGWCGAGLAALEALLFYFAASFKDL